MRQYKGPCQVIAIWAINNFTAHKALNVCIRVFSDSYKYYMTNNFERLIEEEGSKITSIITTPILTTISIHIGLIGFVKAKAPEMVFDTNKKILEELVIIKKICGKQIFAKCVGLY